MSKYVKDRQVGLGVHSWGLNTKTVKKYIYQEKSDFKESLTFCAYPYFQSTKKIKNEIKKKKMLSFAKLYRKFVLEVAVMEKSLL